MSNFPADVVPIFAVISPERIAELKAVLEAHEGLCIERTLDPERGEIVILALPDTLCEVQALLKSLETEMGLRIVPAPGEIEGDWLLSADKSA